MERWVIGPERCSAGLPLGLSKGRLELGKLWRIPARRGPPTAHRPPRSSGISSPAPPTVADLDVDMGIFSGPAEDPRNVLVHRVPRLVKAPDSDRPLPFGVCGDSGNTRCLPCDARPGAGMGARPAPASASQQQNGSWAAWKLGSCSPGARNLSPPSPSPLHRTISYGVLRNGVRSTV